MPLLSDAEISELRRSVNEDRSPSTGLAALKTRAELIGFLVAEARKRGQDEVELVDTVVRLAQPHREGIREDAKLLGKLGYEQVSEHLRKLARRLPSRPPSRWGRYVRAK
jgi:hypothetical protein